MANLPEDIVTACRRFQQGDLVTDVPLLVVADLNRPLTEASKAVAKKAAEQSAPLGIRPIRIPVKHVCILSQTCDIISPSDNRPSVVIAPVIAYDDPNVVPAGEKKAAENLIKEVQSGERVRQFHLDLPGHADFPAGGFVDLGSVTSVEKSLLLSREPIRTLTSPELRRTFAFRAAHVYDRPAIEAPFDEHVVKPLRKFLTRLKKKDPDTFAFIESEIEDEWLWLDDPDSPKVGTLYFVGEKIASKRARDILDEWWEELQNDLPADCTLTKNIYASYASISMEKGRAMSLLTHWYLSEDAGQTNGA